MDTVIDKLSEIEAAAQAITDEANARKKAFAQEMDQKTKAFDAELEQETSARIRKVQDVDGSGYEPEAGPAEGGFGRTDPADSGEL